MTLVQMLGDQGLNLFVLQVGAMSEVLERRGKGRLLDQAYMTATTAEMGLFVQAAIGRLDWPLKVTEHSIQLVEYCANCYDYSCPHGVATWNPVRDLCVYCSHYGKLAQLLGPKPEQLLADQPADAYKKIENSSWEMVFKDHDPDGIAKRVATLLWQVKARIILGKSNSEDDLADGLAGAAERLGLPQFIR